MRKMKNYAIKFIYILLSLILALIIINAVFFQSVLRKDYDFPLHYLLLLCCSFFVMWIVIFIIIPLIKKYNRLSNYLFIVIGIIWQMVIISSIQGASGIDDFDIRIQVANFVNGQSNFDNYFIYGSNNIPITLLFTGIAKLFKFLGLSNYLTLGLNLFQCLILDVTIGAVFSLLKCQEKDVEASLFLFTVLLFVPINIYLCNIYTDVISSCLAILGAVLFYKFVSTSRYLFLLTSGILEATAYLIKMNLIVMAISIGILIVIGIKPQNTLRTFLLFIISFLIIVVPYNCSLRSIDNFSNEQINRYSFPYSFWINVGLDSETYGQFDGNLWNKGNNIPQLKQRKKYYNNLLKKEITSYKPKSLLKLYLQKTNVMYLREI